jgi:glycosyltransferase involved in cell wall biosynthesis
MNQIVYSSNTLQSPSLDGVVPPQRAPGSRYRVICVCGGIGFPVGGSAKRIINVGRALQAAGIEYRVLNCAPSPISLNTERFGVYKGVAFEYTTWLRRPENALARFPVYLRALAGLTWRLCRAWPSRRRTAVYLFVLNGPLVLYTGILCRLLGIPLVQEMCEWFPGDANVPAFTKWLYRKPMFALATGVLAISTVIERRVQEVSAAVNPRLLVHHLPSMVDTERFVTAEVPAGAEAVPHFVWCGVGYPQDVLFLIRVIALVNREGYRCRLRIVAAAFHAWGPDTVRDYAAAQGLPADGIDLVAGVDDLGLAAIYKSAAALLLPMWDDDKSRTRVPNKLAEYLGSGRPVVASAVGDIADFLVDGVNAYLGKPGSERDFADNMIAILRDPERACRIGAAGQKTCMDRMDFSYQVDSLSKFFIRCIGSRRQTPLPGTNSCV